MDTEGYPALSPVPVQKKTDMDGTERTATSSFSNGSAEMVVPAASRKVKSTLLVKGICCAAEVPIVRRVLKPLKGVSEVNVVATTKLVHVFHDPDVITAAQISDALKKEKVEGKYLVRHVKIVIIVSKRETVLRIRSISV